MAVPYPTPKGAQVVGTFSGTLSSGVNSEYVLPLQDGFAGVAFHLNCPRGGSVIFEGTYDDANWFSATARKVDDGYVTIATGSQSYIGSVAGMRSFRGRVLTAGSGDGTMVGTLQRFQHTLDGMDTGPASDFFLNMAEGKVGGYSIVNKFGRNRNITANSGPQDITSAGGIYAGFPTGVFSQVRVYSSATGDSTNGLGARSLNIIGLDAGFNIQSEVFPLSGTQYVTGLKTFSRVHTASVLSAGSNGYNVGQISCEMIPPNQSVVFFRMYTGTNQTNESVYTVPAGKTAYIRDFYATLNHIVGAQTNQIREANLCFLIRPSGGVFRQRRPIGISSYQAVSYEIEGGLQVPAKSDIVVMCSDASDTIDVSAGYDAVLVDNLI